MSTSSLALQQAETRAARLIDYIELTKPRIAVLVLVTVGVAGFVARWGQPDLLILLHAVLGTVLVAGSASALNQWLEHRVDALMERTRERPLPAGRLPRRRVLLFGLVSGIVGLVYLALWTTWWAALWAAVSWFLYVVVYTPLKQRSSWNTTVGAVSGALPVMIGWSAVGGSLDVWRDPRGLALFLLVFFWQFPHFMAIAWIYRRQYERAGMRMLTVVEQTGRRAGLQAVACAMALLPVSFIPAMMSPLPGTTVYLAAALLLGVGQLACAIAFLRCRDDRSARRLLRASLIYLPTLLALLLIVPLV